MLTPALTLAALLAAAEPLPPGAVARLGAPRLRFATADGVAFAPDGSLVATIDVRDGLHLWDVAAARFVAHRRTPVASTRILFTPDGRHVAFEDRDGVGLWDVRDGSRTTIPVEGGVQVSITALAFAPGGRLAIGAHDRSRFKKSVRVLDRATGRELWRAETAGAVMRIAFAADGSALTAADDRGTAYHVAEGGTSRSVQLFDDRLSNGRSAVLTAGGRYFVWLSGHGELSVRDTDSGREAWSLPGTRIGAADVTPDGRTLVAVTWPEEAGATLATYDLATGRPDRRFPLPPAEWGAPRCLADGRTVALVGHPMRLWDLASGKPIPQPGGHADAVRVVAVTPDGRRLVSGDGLEVRGWDLATGRTAWRAPGNLLHVARDGRALAGNTLAGRVTVLDPAAGRPVREIAFGGPPPVGMGTARLSADGRTAVLVWLDQAAGGRQVVVEEHDLAPGGKGRVVKPAGMEMPQAVASDGRWVFGYRETPGLRVRMLYDRLTGRTTDVAASDQQSIILASTPDGRTVVWQSYAKADDGSGPAVRCLLTFVEVATGRERLTVPVPAGGDDPQVWRAEFAPDGRAVAVAWRDGRVAVLDARTGGEFVTLAGTGSPATGLAFVPTGRRLITGHADSTILAWDLVPALPPATPAQLDRWWAALAGDDARQAYAAVWGLAGAADVAVPYVRDRLKPAGPPTDQTRKLVADLDAPQFAVREAASRKLGRLGYEAIPALREGLAANPSAEQRRRIQTLLDAAERGRSPDAIRQSRAVWALEAAGTAEARRLLEALAGGAAEAPLTVEAREAVDRLRHH